MICFLITLSCFAVFFYNQKDITEPADAKITDIDDTNKLQKCQKIGYPEERLKGIIINEGIYGRIINIYAYQNDECYTRKCILNGDFLSHNSTRCHYWLTMGNWKKEENLD
jgi:hypothetical protein